MSNVSSTGSNFWSSLNPESRKYFTESFSNQVGSQRVGRVFPLLGTMMAANKLAAAARSFTLFSPLEGAKKRPFAKVTEEYKRKIADAKTPKEVQSLAQEGVSKVFDALKVEPWNAANSEGKSVEKVQENEASREQKNGMARTESSKFITAFQRNVSQGCQKKLPPRLALARLVRDARIFRGLAELCNAKPLIRTQYNFVLQTFHELAFHRVIKYVLPHASSEIQVTTGEADKEARKQAYKSLKCGYKPRQSTDVELKAKNGLVALVKDETRMAQHQKLYNRFVKTAALLNFSRSMRSFAQEHMPVVGRAFRAASFIYKVAAKKMKTFV